METKGRTFLAPLNDACGLLREGKDELAMVARALHLVGNDKLADRLAVISKEINDAIVKVGEGRDMALRARVYGAEQATRHMIGAPLAVSRQ